MQWARLFETSSGARVHRRETDGSVAHMRITSSDTGFKLGGSKGKDHAQIWDLVEAQLDDASAEDLQGGACFRYCWARPLKPAGSRGHGGAARGAWRVAWCDRLADARVALAPRTCTCTRHPARFPLATAPGAKQATKDELRFTPEVDKATEALKALRAADETLDDVVESVVSAPLCRRACPCPCAPVGSRADAAVQCDVAHQARAPATRCCAKVLPRRRVRNGRQAAP